MNTLHKIIIGDSRRMAELGDESVHLVITSPPYWQLKDYGNGSQIGYHDSYQDYINHLNLVWQECHRVLHQGCRLCINIGDQFARSAYYGRYKVIPIRTEIIRFCESAGFDYMGAVIWRKVTTTNTTGGATLMGSYPFPRNGILKLDYEFILLFKKQGVAPKVSRQVKEQSKLDPEEWKKLFTGHWNFPGERQGRHLAAFPEELPSRLIKMFSFAGETVLDPFLGSGTTCLAAIKLGRSSVGYEINEDYLTIIKEKIGCSQRCIFQEYGFEIIKQKEIRDDFTKEMGKLPYIFNDPIKFDKKVDPKVYNFGSKIDGSYSEREEYYSVKEIISPEFLILGNGQKIRLLGIKEIPEKKEKAVQFLKDKTRGQKVFLKFDKIKTDGNNNLLCYIYLKNKTFLNAHLVRECIVDVDSSIDFKNKTKFLKLSKIEEK